jgi:hypothetical protein
MAELTAFPKDSGSEPVFYRRMSGFAIAGFVAGAFFTVYILIEAAVGFRSGDPVLLSPLMQAIPIAGIVLSLIALLAISRSEGTLGGRGLAVWGVWLSLVVGLGYIAYYGATYAAVRQQADDFVVRWFQKLAQGKIAWAFLDTQSPSLRLRANPENLPEIEIRFNQVLRPTGTSGAEAKGMFDIFRGTDWVKGISYSGSDIQIEPLGVSDWGYTNREYKVRRLYRITSRDGVYEILVPAVGTESERHEFEGRQWNIAFPETKLASSKLSESAARINSLRSDASRFATAWMLKIQRGELTSAYLDTQPPEQRDEIHARFRRARTARLSANLTAASLPQLGGPAAVCLNFAPISDFGFARALYLPGFASRFQRSELVDTKKLYTADPTAREAVVTAVQGLLSVARADLRLGQIDVDASSGHQPWETDSQDRLISPHDCRFLVVSKGFDEGNQHAYAGEAVITVESGPGVVLKGAKEMNWRIMRLELVKASETTLPGMNRLPGKSSKTAPGKLIPKAK